MKPKLSEANKAETEQPTEAPPTDGIYKQVEQMEYTTLLEQPTEASSRDCWSNLLKQAIEISGAINLNKQTMVTHCLRLFVGLVWI